MSSRYHNMGEAAAASTRAKSLDGRDVASETQRVRKPILTIVGRKSAD
jgi:hypothetical protein